MADSSLFSFLPLDPDTTLVTVTVPVKQATAGQTLPGAATRVEVVVSLRELVASTCPNLADSTINELMAIAYRQGQEESLTEWDAREIRVGYPTSIGVWEACASPAHLITAKAVLEHAQAHFDANGDHYLTVRLAADAKTARPVLDDETMADLPVINGAIEMRLVKVI